MTLCGVYCAVVVMIWAHSICQQLSSYLESRTVSEMSVKLICINCWIVYTLSGVKCQMSTGTFWHFSHFWFEHKSDMGRQTVAFSFVLCFVFCLFVDFWLYSEKQMLHGLCLLHGFLCLDYLNMVLIDVSILSTVFFSWHRTALTVVKGS